MDPLNAADNITGAIASVSAYNLIGAGKSGGLKTGVNGNRVGVSLTQLKLGTLANNGGPTRTIALLAGSIAIDAGSNAKALGLNGRPLATDQRGVGYARIRGGKVDVGAFEVQSAREREVMSAANCGNR